MKMYDRLYKEITFPPLILDLLTCPGLLRLRDVRMANNQFVAFPAFSTTSRYEHSLGVCYLSGICAEVLGVSEKEKTELMMAGLYHDVGTPPFAHAMEEVLQVRFGFDHELNLKKLIMGTTGEFEGELAQIYLGEGLKIHSVCQSPAARKLGIDLHRVARLAAGDKDEGLAPLLNGSGMDLDNIDNILRASSAMGLIPDDCGALARTLASSFDIDRGKVVYKDSYLPKIREWQRIRNVQYSAIYESVEDFSYQTMIKKAIQLLLEEDENAPGLDVNSWKLTDSELTNKYLLVHNKSKEIMERVQLCRPFSCLGIFYVSGKNVVKYVNQHLKELEGVASECVNDIMGFTQKRLKSSLIGSVAANFYPDKRKRNIIMSAPGRENVKDINDRQEEQGVFLGFFTPFRNYNIKEFNYEGYKERKSVSFRKQDLQNLINVLKRDLLKHFRVLTLEEEYEENSASAGSGQLGLF